MSTASKVRCGIVYDKKTGEIRRVVKADSKSAMRVGANVQPDEDLVPLEKDTYNNLKSFDDLEVCIAAVQPELIANLKIQRETKVLVVDDGGVI